MKCRAIKKDDYGYYEWCFGHSIADYKTQASQIVQDIYTALREWKYNCFFAMENGIDWYRRLGFTKQKELLDDEIQEIIKARVGVLAVVNFESEIEDRHYYCTCDVLQEYSAEALNIDFSI